jgi:hypothetical protein
MQRFVSRMLYFFKTAILMTTHDVLPAYLYTPYESIGVETNQRMRKTTVLFRSRSKRVYQSE